MNYSAFTVDAFTKEATDVLSLQRQVFRCMTKRCLEFGLKRECCISIYSFNVEWNQPAGKSFSDLGRRVYDLRKITENKMFIMLKSFIWAFLFLTHSLLSFSMFLRMVLAATKLVTVGLQPHVSNTECRRSPLPSDTPRGHSAL